MQPGETVKLVNLSVRKKSVLLDSPKGRAEGEQEININTFIILYTNITNVRIPLMAFDGKLKPVIKLFFMISVPSRTIFLVFSFYLKFFI